MAPSVPSPVNPYHNHVSKYGRAGYDVSGKTAPLVNTGNTPPVNNPYTTTTMMQPMVRIISTYINYSRSGLFRRL